MRHVWVLAILGALLSCSPEPEADNSALQEELIGTTWRLTDLTGQDVLADLPVLLSFMDSTSITGSGGCNRYFAEYTLSGNKLKLGPIGSTRMTCAEDTVQQEDLYFEALQQAKSVQLDEDQLIIECEGYVQPLRFTRREKPYEE